MYLTAILPSILGYRGLLIWMEKMAAHKRGDKAFYNMLLCIRETRDERGELVWVPWDKSEWEDADNSDDLSKLLREQKQERV
jgi:hypothetical protein